MAKQSGADWTLNNGQHSLAEFLQQKALKPTLIVDAACHPAILQEAITSHACGTHCPDGIFQRPV